MQQNVFIGNIPMPLSTHFKTQLVHCERNKSTFLMEFQGREFRGHCQWEVQFTSFNLWALQEPRDEPLILPHLFCSNSGHSVIDCSLQDLHQELVTFQKCYSKYSFIHSLLEIKGQLPIFCQKVGWPEILTRATKDHPLSPRFSAAFEKQR